MGRKSLPFPRELKKKLFPSPMWEGKLKKISSLSTENGPFFSFLWVKNLFFFHVGREIEKNFFSSLNDHSVDDRIYLKKKTISCQVTKLFRIRKSMNEESRFKELQKIADCL